MAASRRADREWTDSACPVARTIDLVGDRWSLLIVRDAMDGAAAFTEFQQRLGIARNILADRLRRLVDHGILTTGTAPSGKRRIYRLTEAGEDLFTTVVALRQWGERHAFHGSEPHSTLAASDGSPLAPLRAETADGRPVSAATTRVHKTTRIHGTSTPRQSEDPSDGHFVH